MHSAFCVHSDTSFDTPVIVVITVPYPTIWEISPRSQQQAGLTSPRPTGRARRVSGHALVETLHVDPGKVELCTFSKPVLETQISASLVLVWFGAAMSNPPKKEGKGPEKSLYCCLPFSLFVQPSVHPSVFQASQCLSVSLSVCACGRYIVQREWMCPKSGRLKSTAPRPALTCISFFRPNPVLYDLA